MAKAVPVDPPVNCVLCERLVTFRKANQATYPDFFNGAVPSFGDADAALLIVGLAPGLQGANKTGRPFTGDFAGDLLYATLEKFGFSNGRYAADPGDGLILKQAMITNAVRCVPPQNKPVGSEIKTCRKFLKHQIAALGNLRVILCLGRIAHDSTLAALDIKPKSAPFGHGASAAAGNGVIRLYDSYHCSRYNTNTGRLTTEMFEAVFAEIRRYIDGG